MRKHLNIPNKKNKILTSGESICEIINLSKGFPFIGAALNCAVSCSEIRSGRCVFNPLLKEFPKGFASINNRLLKSIGMIHVPTRTKHEVKLDELPTKVLWSALGVEGCHLSNIRIQPLVLSSSYPFICVCFIKDIKF